MFDIIMKFFKFAGMFTLCFWGFIGLIIVWHILPAIILIASYLLLGCGLVYWVFRLLKALCNLLMRLLIGIR